VREWKQRRRFQRLAFLGCILCAFGCGKKDSGFGPVQYGFYNAKEVISSSGERADYNTSYMSKGHYLVYSKDRCEFMLTPGECKANGDSLEISFSNANVRLLFYTLGIFETEDSSNKVVLRRIGRNELSFRYAKDKKTIILEKYTLAVSD